VAISTGGCDGGLQDENSAQNRLYQECLVSDVGFYVTGHNVVEVFAVFISGPSCPIYIRSDNGPEFIAEAVREFLAFGGIDTLYTEPGSPWGNGYVESFDSRMRDELLDGELFLHIDEVKYVVDRWRMDYNHYRPHSGMGYMTPAACAQLCRGAWLRQTVQDGTG